MAACVGLPPPPPGEGLTTSQVVATTSETGDSNGSSGSTSGGAEGVIESSGGSTTTVEASTSEVDACLGVDCPPGEHCVEGVCFACADSPICNRCRGLQVCQCPVDDPCCEIGVCIAQACDPLVQDCPEGAGCYPAGDDWNCAIDASDDMGARGDPCEFVNACDPGLVCVVGTAVPGCMGVGCCSNLCDVTDPSGDAQCLGAGQVCTPWYETGTAPAGYEDVGACALP